ncbi:hypothetical protein U9M48_037652 [Paspalum notatum var. saurae]|uniref:Uncharacterized protein n=1 Tax=Paspalum notatum var. saurae TaxID=547442 RepID=A0AAQ3UGE7_PASNO
MPKPTARRVSDLLQEQQEPFLRVQGHSETPSALGRTLLLCLLCGGSNAVAAKPLQRRRWGRLAACFPCAVPASRKRFRRLPRAGAGVGDGADCCDAATAMVDCGGTQLSPVSVLDLELRSDDDDSPDHCNWVQEQDDDGKPTTSGPSPPPSSLGLTAGAHADAIVGTGGDQRKQRRAFSLSTLPEKEKAVVSSWERIAADISRIPTMVALDLSGSGSVAGEEEEEARRLVGQSIEAMIFEEVRWEAVRDMILLASLHSTHFSS